MRPISKTLALGAAISATLSAQAASAKNITVEMRNQSPAGIMVFEPAFVKAKVGDAVHFVPIDLGHNAETIPGILPDEVQPSKGAMNKEFVLRLSKRGLYGVKCMPHISMGMVALVQAGDGPSANLAAARAVTLPPLAAKRLAPYLQQAK
jgi:pseudoazurin